jgi:2-deoxy-D-gluconate 3-dehydrogenase
MDEVFGLRGKVALVTGAGIGIGRAIAQYLARAGCRVALADIDEATMAETAGLIGGEGGEARGFRCNVRVEGEVTRLVDEVAQTLGGLDIAVHNVGSMPGRSPAPFLELAPEAWDDVVQQNFRATFLCCHAAARKMVALGKGGCILNISSGESQRNSPYFIPYGSAKAAINHMTATMALELGPHGIRVNAIAPGTTLTPNVKDKLPPGYVEALLPSIPLRRMTEPEDMGRAALFFASDLARDITGQFLLIDGGANLSRNRPPLEPRSR